jgi:microcompartment protein CcmL/EutN
MDLNVIQQDPAMMVAAAVIGMGLLGLLAEAFFSSMRRPRAGKSPIMVTGDAPAMSTSARVAAAAAVDVAPKVETKVEAVPEPVSDIAPIAPSEPPKDPIEEQRRFFATLGSALNIDETAPAALSALHANLSSDVFMERMTLATKAWKPDGFAVGARELKLRADGTPPDTVATKVLEGYEQLKNGQVKAALEAFLAAIDAANTAAAADTGNPWPHAWSAFAWRGLALIAEEAGDVQATLAGLKVAYQSMVNAFELTLETPKAA